MTIIHGIDPNNEMRGIKTTTDGTLPVKPGPTGTPKTFVNAAVQAPTDADVHRVTDATGFKAFRVRPMNGLNTSVTALAFGWSTAASDFANVNLICDELIAELIDATPTGAAHENVMALLPIEAAAGLFESPDWIVWDGVTKIKTILCKSEGADQGNVVIETLA